MGPQPSTPLSPRPIMMTWQGNYTGDPQYLCDGGSLRETALEEATLFYQQASLGQGLQEITPREQVLIAIESSGPSSPGPDGLPFEGYKAVKETAAMIIQRVAFNLVHLQEADIKRLY